MNLKCAVLCAIAAIPAIQMHAMTYEIGEIVEIQGQKALVFELDDAGVHGKAINVKAFRGVDSPWCNNRKAASLLPLQTNSIDGLENTRSVIEFAKANNCMDAFPVFKWCDSMGDSWYVPSLKELEEFVNYWLGNTEELQWEDEVEYEISVGMDFYKQINNRLLDAGGFPLINDVYTSTETDKGQVYIFEFDRNKYKWKFKLRNKFKLGSNSIGRAMIRF